MPLVRAEVRNEYALGAPELYREVNKEDPKEILEGVAVAGLVGVLRQLGDLAEFAAEVFHGLQEEVMRTSSRSHKMLTRVQRIETALSPLEKALLAQRSHLHFAYTAGSDWRARIRCEQNHFVYSDVPQFIMDSYDDSRGPPRLHLLDRFDTAGAGSCMKRYSDPTFFKKASVASGEASADRTLKDKKGRKIKKRRSWTRSREVSRDASFSHHRSRTRFSQMNGDGQSSPSQTASTYDATTHRSDMAEQTSLNLRNGSGYAQGRSHLITSVQPEEQEDSMESISSSVKRRESDFLDYNFLEGKITDAFDDDIQIYPSQEQAGCTSSSVTLDENNQSVEPTIQDYDKKHLESFSPDLETLSHKDRHLESFSSDLDLETLGHDRHLESISSVLDLETLSHNAVDFETLDQTVPALESGDAHLDDIESETDQFMDALNTIESECETDADCTKKQEFEHYSKSEAKEIECQSSSSETNALPNSSLTNGNIGLINPISLSPESMNEFNSVPTNALAVSSLTNGNIDHINPISLSPETMDEFNSVPLVDRDLQSSSERVTGNSPTPGSPMSADARENDNITDDGVNNVESVSSNCDGTKICLESVKHVPETSNVTSVTFWTNGGLLGLQPSKPPDFSVLNAPPRDPTDNQAENFKHTMEDQIQCTTSFRKTMWKIPPADLDVKLGKLGDSSLHGKLDRKNEDDNNYGNITGSKVVENRITSSRMFELSNGLLSTGSSKKLFPSEEQITKCTFFGQNKDLFGGESPPLGHMKISFQPIDGFETSKLKLKFPNRNTESTQSVGDIFPSFQLVPDASFTLRRSVGSDSDADTFYRSSPSLSDNDSHSNQSESNSEQWESSESPTGKDQDLYEALRRVSLSESVSTVPENDRTNGEDVHGSFGRELRNYIIGPEGVIGPQFVATHAPPPPPPVEWQGTGITHSASTISQPKPAPISLAHNDTTDVQKSKQSSSQKSNGHHESKHVDEKEDFLHQIRTKSFNLRPTVTTKPVIPSGCSGNVQVSAILEKANAIRQAVGSDGEDDGSWSEA